MNPAGECVSAVVFDWAGTTVDHGSRAPAIVFEEIFRRRGVEITSAQAREPMGMAKREHIASILSMPAVAQAWQAVHGRPAGERDIDTLYDEFLPLQKQVLAAHSDVIPGVAAAVASLREIGLKIGSTTGYTRELMQSVTATAAKQGYAPDCVLCAEDAPRGRPAPFLLYLAAIRLDVYPLSTLINVDDTTMGIAAGRNAGCWNVGITRTGNGVGLSAAELADLPAAQATALCDQAARALTAAGAHYTIDSAAGILEIVHDINRRLKQGESPQTARNG